MSGTSDFEGVREDIRRRIGEESFWRTAGTLYRSRRLIVLVTGGAGVLSIIVSLLIPNWYRASSRLLLPESGGGGLPAAILGDLGSAAQSFLGVAGGDYTRYLAIMNSRNVLSAVVDTFGLVDRYGLAGKATPEEDALELLSDRIEFTVDHEYNYLTVSVVDEDPVAAAAMTNHLVILLDRVNNELASGTAARFRRYVESRYDEATSSRSALLDSLQAFQKRYGVFDLEAQTAAFFSQIADLRIRALQAEIEFEAVRSRLGPANSDLASMEELARAANAKYEEALEGRERIFPVPQAGMPDMVRDYVDLEMERTIQERILQYVAPMLEQARFEEQRTIEALQTVDRAIPPARKAGPRRSIICVVTTLSALILILAYVLAADWWLRRYSYYARRLREAMVSN